MILFKIPIDCYLIQKPTYKAVDTGVFGFKYYNYCLQMEMVVVMTSEITITVVHTATKKKRKKLKRLADL